MNRGSRIALSALAIALALLCLVCKKVPVGSPPDAPSTPAGISNGGYNTTYEFTSAASDSDGDSVALKFSWGDGATSDWSPWVASGETVAMSHSWSSAGSYQVKTQAKDRPGLTSDWSATFAVTIVATQSPNTPGAPTGPSAAPKDSLCSFTTIATDPDGDGVSYRFEWGTGDTSAWTDWVPSGQPATMQYTLPRAGTPGVRAQARDVNEALSAWSNPHAVTIPNPYPPSTPDMESVPGSCAADETLSLAAASSDSAGDSIAIRFSWGDGDTSDWSDLVPSGEYVTMTHAWSDSGTYSIEAQARDEDSAATDWSEACSVYVWRPKWRYPTGGAVRSSPAIAADGTVYVGSDDHYLYAFDPNGTLKWRYPTEDAVRSSPAIAADGTVYVGSDDHYLYALDPNGTLKWHYQFGDVVCASPAIAADGTVYACARDSCLLAINPDGSLKWRCPTGMPAGSSIFYSSPAIATDGTVYVGCTDHYLYAIDPNGGLKWRFQTESAIFSSPAVGSDGTVYVGSFDRYLYAVNPDASLRWRYSTGEVVSSSPTIAADGTVYVAPSDTHLYAIHPDGSLKWRFRTYERDGGKTAIADDGTVYVGSECLYAINADGSLKWYRKSGSAIYFSGLAIAADGTVYVGSVGNCVYAIEGDSPLADSPWPKFRHDNRNTGRVGAGR
jgi:outer membrane protein assembly factor BamB